MTKNMEDGIKKYKECGEWVSQLAWATITIYHKLGGVHNGNLLFHSSED